MKKLWIAAKPSNESIKLLNEFVSFHNIKNPVTDFHSTIIEGYGWRNFKFSQFTAKPSHIEVWKTRLRENLILVLDSPDLVEMNRILANDVFQLKPHKFIPHITLSYNFSKFINEVPKNIHFDDLIVKLS